MIQINKILNKPPTVCKWCKSLPMEETSIYMVEIEGLYDRVSFIVCKNCLREMKQAISLAFKEKK